MKDHDLNIFLINFEIPLEFDLKEVIHYLIIDYYCCCIVDLILIECSK